MRRQEFSDMVAKYLEDESIVYNPLDAVFYTIDGFIKAVDKIRDEGTYKNDPIYKELVDRLRIIKKEIVG